MCHTIDMTAKWFTVVIEGEVPTPVGPYKSEAIADAVATKWNKDHAAANGGDQAYVLPMVPNLDEVPW